MYEFEYSISTLHTNPRAASAKAKVVTGVIGGGAGRGTPGRS